MIKNILIACLFIPLPAVAQQVNEYDVCTRYRETYVPGYYDSYGNYISGRVESESYKVPCGTGYQNNPEPQPRYRRQVYCDPTRSLLGATLGGGVAASMSRGDGYKWSVPLGAFLGGVGFGCR